MVAVNPWRGHALLYAFGSRQVVFYSEKAVTTPDRQLVADQLYLAASPLRRPGLSAPSAGWASTTS